MIYTHVPTAEVTSVVLSPDCAVILEATDSRHHTYDTLCGCADAVKLAHRLAQQGDRLGAHQE